MASGNIIEFLPLHFKPSLLTSPSSPPAALAALATQLQTAAGVKQLYQGQQIEDPSQWLWMIVWDSDESSKAFAAHLGFPTWFSALAALLVSFQKPTFVALGGEVQAVLNAPVAEIASFYGVEDGFLERRARKILGAVDRSSLPGHHGSASGSFEQHEQVGDDVVAGPAVRMVLGWDSREAHLSQVGEGSVIQQNAHYLSEGYKGMVMYHAKLTML